MHRAAGGGVQQRAQQSAVDDAHRVVGGLIGGACEQRLAVADRQQLGADERCHRGRRELAGDDRLQELAARQGRTGGC